VINGKIREVTEDMGMLKSISLKNYKCFKDETTIDIAPLTVLCGVNSSGKSSILKSLLMLKQSYESESSSHSLLLSGDYVDNGSFDDIIYHNKKDDINKNTTFKITNTYLIRDTSNEQGKNLVKRQDIVSFKELKRVFYQIKDIKKVKYFKLLIEIVVERPNESEASFEFYIESNIIRSYNIELELLDSNQKSIDDMTHYIYITKNEHSEKAGWVLNVNGIPSTKGTIPTILCNYPCTCYFSGLQIKNLYADSMPRDVIYTLPNLLSIFKIAAFQTDGINFIAPLREQPVRRYSLNGNVDSVGISGEKMPMLLAKEYNSIKTDCIPPIVLQNGEKKYVKWGYKKDTFSGLVRRWMNYLELGTLDLANKTNGLISLNINEHNIVDVGFGVGQALPIIVQGLYMNKDQSLLLEQPEIHLHPEMQLQMADFLIALAKNEKNVIVETHSDHFINRIIHRVMQNYDELNDIIKIYIVEKDEETHSSSVRLKKIDKYKGTEKDKSKFFFTQYDSEITDIVDTGLNNMMEI